MTAYDYDIGILGGGAAGLTVVSGAAQLGAKTLLVESEEKLGGDCLHFGCVPSKTLIRTAQVYHAIEKAESFGLPSVEMPPVDFQKVRERIQAVISTIQKHDSEERFCDLGAKVVFGNPSFSDEHSIRLNGETVSAKNWVIATGSSPGIPPIKGLDKTPYLTNREIFSLDRLPESMAILGAGPIAIEMAQAFSRLGTTVFVVQRSEQILSKEDKDMADGVMQVLSGEGVTFCLNASILDVKDMGKSKEVRFKDKAGKINSLTVETILVAMGRDPNVKGLGLDGIGIETSRKGIQVDDRLRTAQKHIYAAGDVTGAFQFTHATGYEGGIVVANAIFHLPRKTDYTLLPWCTYVDPALAAIGMNEKTAAKAGIQYTVFSEDFKDNDRSLAEGESAGKIKMILSKDEKPIGVQILGSQAGELLNEWVAVLNGKVKLSTLGSAVHPYPTLGEINKRVAGSYLSPKIFSPKVKKRAQVLFSFERKSVRKEHK